MERNAACNAARTLKRDVEAVERILAERAFDGGLDTEEDAKRGMWPRIATDVPRRVRKAGHRLGRTSNFDHVGDAHPDVFRGDVTPAQILDRLAKGVQHLRSLVLGLVREDDGLAATQRQAGHRIL